VEGFEYEGVFWPPERPEQKIVGKLTFDPDEGIELYLFGYFGELVHSFEAGSARRDIILGVAGRKELTLVNADHAGFNFEAPGMQRERYRVEVVLAGHHFTELDHLLFNAVHVNLGSLEQWVGKTSIGYSLTFDAREQFIATEARLQPLPKEYSLGDSDDVVLHFDYKFGGDQLEEFRLRNGCHFEVVTEESRTLDAVIDDAAGIQHLLTLCTGRAVPLQEITLTSEDIEYDFRGEYRMESITYHAALPSSWIKAEKSTKNYEMIATYDQLGGVAGVHRWLKVSRSYSRVLNSLLAARYAKQIYAENRFQNSVGAAETLDRMKFDNFLSLPVEYKAFKKKLVKNVPSEHRDWLHQQLQYSNEPRLKQRLFRLANMAGDPFPTIVGENVEAWVKVVSGVRNRLTHYDQEQEGAFSGRDLYLLSESVLILLMLCLFVEADVATESLAGVANNQRILLLRRGLTEAVPRLEQALGKS
jgi:hypothetical protein